MFLYFVNFTKFLGELSSRIPSGDHFWHDVVFLFFFCRSMRIAAKKNYFVERCYITKKNSGTGSILYSYGSQSGTSLARRWSVMCTFIIRFFKCKIFLKAGKKTAEMASGIRTILINTMFPLHRLGFTPLWNWYRIGFLLSL